MTDQQRRAMKVWQVLIAYAAQHETIAYGRLAELIEEPVGANLLRPYLDRVEEFCLEDTLDRIIEGVAEISRGFLQEKLNEQSCISDQKKKVIAEIKNINDVLKQAGDQAPNLTTLLKDLAKLERERETLEKADSQITKDSEEALLFVNDKNGIIETALSLKTFTDPADPDAVRELMKIFIKKVAIFPREPGAKKQRGLIDYYLPARQAGPPDVPDTETVYFEKRKTPADPKSCVFDDSTGVYPSGETSPQFTLSSPRTYGGMPNPMAGSRLTTWLAPYLQGYTKHPYHLDYRGLAHPVPTGAYRS